MTMRRRVAAVCVMLATMTVALGACTGNTAKTGSSGQTDTGNAAVSAASEANGAVTADSTDSGSAGASTPERDRIVIAIPQDLDALDPHKATAAGTREVLFNVFEGLVKPDENGNLVPAIASDWTISDDAKTYTFTLHENVTFHDGSAVTAQDVVYSLNRCLDEATASPYQGNLSAISSVEVNGEGQVVVTLANGDSDFLAQLTVPVIPEAVKDPEAAPIGTGPYKYVSRAPLQNVILEKYDDYYNSDGAAHIKTVELKIESDPNTVAMGLESGAIDMFCRLTPEQMERLKNAENLEISEGTMNLVVAVYLNNNHEPFRDVRVRQALSYACDAEEIMAFMFDGAGIPVGSSMFPAFGKYYDDSLKDVYATDTEKAKELLAEAGYPDGFTFTIQVPSNYQQYVDMSQILREQFLRIGVTMEIQLIEWASWLSDVYSAREYEATIIGVDASTLTAGAMLDRFRSDASGNFVNFSSDAYDKTYQAAVSSVDDAEKTAAYIECTRILTQEAASAYLMDMPSYTALNISFTGYQFYPLYVQNFASLRSR